MTEAIEDLNPRIRVFGELTRWVGATLMQGMLDMPIDPQAGIRGNLFADADSTPPRYSVAVGEDGVDFRFMSKGPYYLPRDIAYGVVLSLVSR